MKTSNLLLLIFIIIVFRIYLLSTIEFRKVKYLPFSVLLDRYYVKLLKGCFLPGIVLASVPLCTYSNAIMHDFL